MDTIRVSKTINAPLRYVYDWCTDFEEGDPGLTGSKSQRRILEKTRSRVIYAQLYEGADGEQKAAVDIVTLKPRANSWHLDYFGEEDDETGDYKLTSLGKNRTRLEMVFKERWKKIEKIPSKEQQIRQTNDVWDKYVAALEKDYNRSAKK